MAALGTMADTLWRHAVILRNLSPIQKRLHGTSTLRLCSIGRNDVKDVEPGGCSQRQLSRALERHQRVVVALDRGEHDLHTN